MKKNLLLLMILLQSAGAATAQSLAINTDGSTANSSALLDVKSTAKGVLVPRMSKTQRNAIGSPATGLLVFQDSPDSIGFYFFGGTKWQWLTNADNTDTLVWKRSGNAGTAAATHFLGTTDNKPLRFRINNIWAGEIDSAKRTVLLGLGAGQNTGSTTRSNIAIGNAAQKNNALGSGNIIIGDSALYTASNFTSDVIAIGNKALYKNTSGLYLTAIGDSALYNNNFGVKNTAIGYGSSVATTFGNYNTAMGYRSLYMNTTGYENTAIGQVAGFANTTSAWQVAIGDSALYSNTGNFHNGNIAIGAHAAAYNPGSSGCIFIGFRSGWQSSGGFGNVYMGGYSGENSTGSSNVAIGQQALRNITGNNNAAVGYGSLEQNTRGDQNTAVGASTLSRDTTGNYNTALGYWSMGDHLRNDYNTAIGAQSLFFDTVGTRNVAVGYQALFQHNGSNNVGVGPNALDFAGTGNNNTAIGASADVGFDNLSFATAIGASARCDTSNSIVLGNVAGTNVSVGTTKPMSRMDVNGSIGSGVRSITASATALVTDHTIVISSTVGTGTVAITLPSATTCTRREYRIVNQNVTTNKSIVGGYTDFTGANVTSIPANNSIVIQSNGVGWVRVL